MLALGEPVRTLPTEYQGQLPHWITKAEVFCRGCLVLQGASYEEDESLATRVARESAFSDWPMIFLHDKAEVARSRPDFLWATWTRFEPAADIYSAETNVS